MDDLLSLVVIFISVLGAPCQEFIEHPKNATVTMGGNVTLRCKFSTDVTKCTWYRNGTDPVYVKDRYHYYDTTSNGINTSDCSLTIVGFKKFDATIWRCSVAQDADITNTPMSNKAHLTMADSSSMKKTTVVVHPHSVQTPESATPTSNGWLNIDSTVNMTNLLLFVLIGLFLIGMIVFVVVYCHRVNKAKEKEDPKSPPLPTRDRPRSQFDQEIHEYTYITEFEVTSQDDQGAYLVPKDTPMGPNKPAIRLHTYDEVIELV